MTDGRVATGGLLAALICGVGPAAAQELPLTGPLEGAPAVSQRRDASGVSSKRDGRIVMPTGHLEVAGELAFLTSTASPYTERLKLTDMALFRVSARRSFADWLEFYGGVTLLPKQPSTSDGALFEGGYVGGQAEFAKGFGAALSGAAGPLFGADGVFYRAGPGLSWKPSVSHYLRFVLGAGNSWTILDYSDTAERAFWLGEVVTHAETQIGDDNASMWVGVDYAVPFAARPRESAPDPVRGYLDPQVRLNLELGGALSLRADGWDVYASLAIIDRGELGRPETTLPILDGGFDQQQLTIGVEYRFDPQRRDEDEQGW